MLVASHHTSHSLSFEEFSTETEGAPLGTYLEYKPLVKIKSDRGQIPCREAACLHTEI